MLEANIIQHASGSKKQKFVDGFLIYSMLLKTPWQKLGTGKWAKSVSMTLVSLAMLFF